MGKNIIGFLSKFISCVVGIAIGMHLFFSATIVDVLTFSLAVSILTFMIGDLVILPSLGRRAANIIDFTVSYMSIWVFGSVLLNNYIQIGWSSAVTATVFTAAEVLTHRFLFNNAEAPDLAPSGEASLNYAYATEMAEENNVDEVKKEINKEELPKDKD